MKKLLFPVYLVMLLTACKKQQNDPIEVMAPDNIVGTWELRHMQNGMIPDISYPAGNGHLLKLSLTGYQFYTNGQLEKSGNYLLVRDNSSVKGECFELPAVQSISRMIFDGDRNNSKIIQQPSENSLVMLSGCAALDSGSYTSYEKQQRAFSCPVPLHYLSVLLLFPADICHYQPPAGFPPPAIYG